MIHTYWYVFEESFGWSQRSISAELNLKGAAGTAECGQRLSEAQMRTLDGLGEGCDVAVRYGRDPSTVATKLVLQHQTGRRAATAINKSASASITVMHEKDAVRAKVIERVAKLEANDADERREEAVPAKARALRVLQAEFPFLVGRLRWMPRGEDHDDDRKDH